MSERVKHRYEFDCFYFDPQERLLVRNGKPIPLTPKVFDTLILLVENGGHLVLKDDLMKALWPNSFVEEVNLTQNISQLRKALGDNPQEQRYIVTVPGRGYRFAAEVKEATGPRNGSGLIIGRDSRSRDVIEEEHESGSDPELVVAPTPRSKWVIWLTDAGVVGWAKRVVPAALTALAAVGFFMVFHRQPKLVSTDTIVLADFQNKTGDPVFDDTLKQALAAGLQQSLFLHIVSDQKVGEILRLMGHSPRDPLKPEIALDLCQRARSKAVLFGSIASLGNHFAIALNAVSCVTGDSLDREEVEAASKEGVLSALGKATTRLRQKVGESLSSIQKFDMRLDAVTTPSLDALKAWTAATQVRSEKGEAAAVPLLKHAIALDPDFAMAYAELGAVYTNLHQPSLAAASMKKAYELRDRTSQWDISALPTSTVFSSTQTW